MNFRIIIIHKSEIVAEGIAAIARRIPNTISLIVNGIRNVNWKTDSDIFIIDADTFSEEVDLFTDKKNDTIIATYTGNTIQMRNSFPLIPIHSSKEVFLNVIKTIIARKEKEIEYKKEDVNSQLSQREIDVLRLLAKGYTFKEIADTLCISSNTVGTHRKNISSKLGIRSLAALSVYAKMNGIL